MPSRPKSRGSVVVNERPKGGELEGRSGWACIRDLITASPVWSLVLPYGEDAASSLTERVMLL
jgi:hypothetical protein